MRGAAIGLIIVAVLVTLALWDLLGSNPPPESVGCVLDTEVVLPDSCAAINCEGFSSCPPVTTRPYLFVFTQAASCPDLCPIRIE